MTTVIGPAINNPHDDGPSVADVCNQNYGSERQRAMSSGKPGWAGYFSVGSLAATVK
jgi:hypothetical protein